MTRAQFGDVNVAMPSRFLQEIPEGLIEWKQSPGMANSRGGTEPRALNARRGGGAGGFGGGGGGTGAVAASAAAPTTVRPLRRRPVPRPSGRTGVRAGA